VTTLDLEISSNGDRAASPGYCALIFFCAFERQNERSLATHPAVSMLKSGRTAKILASGPAAESFASASVRVFAGFPGKLHT